MWTVRTDKGDETMKESKTMPTKTFDEIRKAHDARIPKKADISEWKKFEEITKNERWVSVDVLQQKLLNLMVIRDGGIYNCQEEDGMRLLLFEILRGKPFQDKREMLRTCGSLYPLRSLKEAEERLDFLLVGLSHSRIPCSDGVELAETKIVKAALTKQQKNELENRNKWLKFACECKESFQEYEGIPTPLASCKLTKKSCTYEDCPKWQSCLGKR